MNTLLSLDNISNEYTRFIMEDKLIVANLVKEATSAATLENRDKEEINKGGPS